jgi:hypothetical protein
MSSGVTIRGDRRLNRNLRNAGAIAREAASDAILAVAYEVFAESQDEVPEDERDLRKSGWVKRITESREPAAKVGYATNYAAIQHETPWFSHRKGKWRYLRDPLDRARNDFNRRIARAVAYNLRRRAQ